MPVSPDLFTVDDTPAFRKWCQFQLYDMPPAAQEGFIQKLRASASVGPLMVRLQAALSVDLPGVDLGVSAMRAMEPAIARAADLILFRFYRGTSGALRPQRAYLRNSDFLWDSIMSANPLDRPIRRFGFAPGQRWPGTSRSKADRAIYSDYAAGLHNRMRITKDDFEHAKLSINRTELEAPLAEMPWNARNSDFLLAYLHQTGRRDGSPYLSCTLVMPKMVRSGSLVLRHDVMPHAPYLGVFLVPSQHRYMLWPDPSRLPDPVRHTIEEAEVLYRFPPPMEVYQLFRIANPWANGTALPGAGDAGTLKLSTTHDPGYAADDMPGLIDTDTYEASR